MGTTPRLLLPYPELNEPANVPTDMRELAEAIEAAIGGPLPNPKYVAVTTGQNITGMQPAWQTANPLVTLQNTHPVLYLLVQVRFGMWLNAKGNVAYAGLKITGATADAEVDSARVENTYTSSGAMHVVTIAPGTTLSAQPQLRRLTDATIPALESSRGSITPVGWLKTGTI